MQTWIHSWLAVAFSALAALATHPSFAAGQLAHVDLAPEQHFQIALEEQSHRNYKAMLRHLRTAAQDGLVEAQEALGMVLLAGPSVYGAAVRAGRCEAFKWFLAAAKGGSTLGTYQVHFLNRARNAYAAPGNCRHTQHDAK